MFRKKSLSLFDISCLSEKTSFVSLKDNIKFLGDCFVERDDTILFFSRLDV